MKTDRELLELAAKVAGIEVTAPMRELWGFAGSSVWNPLTNDADAFGLAMKLRLVIKPGKYKGDGCTVESQQSGVAGCTAFRDDCMEQARHAIVRVAAELAQA